MPLMAALAAVSGAVCVWAVSWLVADLNYQRGAREARNGRLTEAQRWLSRAVSANPAHAGALNALAELNPGDPGAPKLTGAAERLKPASTAPVLTRFERARRAGSAAGMRAALDDARERDPHGLDTRLMEVGLLIFEGRDGEAESELAEMTLIWPRQLDVWLARAALAERRGRPEETRRILRAILSVYPEHNLSKSWLRRMGG